LFHAGETTRKKILGKRIFLLTPYSLYAKNVLSEGGRVMKMQFDLFDQDAANACAVSGMTDLESLWRSGQGETSGREEGAAGPASRHGGDLTLSNVSGTPRSKQWTACQQDVCRAQSQTRCPGQGVSQTGYSEVYVPARSASSGSMDVEWRSSTDEATVLKPTAVATLLRSDWFAEQLGNSQQKVMGLTVENRALKNRLKRIEERAEILEELVMDVARGFV
jgi:hypothetical protein